MEIYSGMLAAYMAALVGMIIVGVLVYAITAFFMSKLFAKAGVQGTWRAWVPVYNFMVFFKLGDLSPWLVLYCFGGSILLSWIGIGFIFSLALFVGGGVAAYRIGMKLGKETGFVAFWLISPVWLGIVAYGRAVEHRRGTRAVGGQRIPRRPHRVGRGSGADLGRGSAGGW